MKVQSSQVSYAATHRFERTDAVMWRRTLRAMTPSPPAARAAVSLDRVSLSSRALVSAPAASAAARIGNREQREDLRGMDAKQVAAALAIEAVVGRRIEWRRLDETAGVAAPATATAAAAAPPESPAAAGSTEVVQRTEIHAEAEQTSFEAAGAVETADGRSIRFNVSLTMERAYESVTTTIIQPQPAPSAGEGQQQQQQGGVKDPLVVNFGGGPARLTDAKVRFDLDSNGESEEISFVAEGSGFLVLDANNDGQANNGRELFGPQTGNGFAELAAYDSDGNQWIDQADPVFSSLRIWTSDGSLSTLAEHGIGAIGVSSAETPFDLKSLAGDNTHHGTIRRTGVYLGEDGSAGTVQHVDLVV